MVLNQNAKGRGSWVPFKIFTKVAKIVDAGGAAYGSVHNLVKPSNLPVSKVRQFFHSKPSYTEFTLATCKFKRMKAFARFRKEIWCMNLAYVDKLAKVNNGVKYLLVRPDLSDRTVDAKRMKKIARKQLVHLLTMVAKKNRLKNCGSTNE